MNKSPAYQGRVKYDAKTARKYQIRPPAKHKAELRLVDRAFSLIPKNSRVLDVPCGGGRVSIQLMQAGYQVTAADLSDAMLGIARESIAKLDLNCPVHKQDVEKLSYPDKEFDAVISFRLFHHFPSAEIRATVVRELCRVARTYVAISYFSPWSITSVKRHLRQALGGRASQKYATPLKEVESYFNQCSFRLVRDFAQSPLIHTLHLAVFERQQAQVASRP